MCKSNHPSLHSIIWQWGSLLFFAGETTYQCLFCHLMWRKSWLKLSRLFQKLSTINCEFISFTIFSLVYCACLEDSYWVPIGANLLIFKTFLRRTKKFICQIFNLLVYFKYLKETLIVFYHINISEILSDINLLKMVKNAVKMIHGCPFLVCNLISHKWMQWTSEILSWTLKGKFHICALIYSLFICLPTHLHTCSQYSTNKQQYCEIYMK